MDKNNHPDLKPLIHATRTVGEVLKSKDIVVFESTVYPGCTEEECIPILEAASDLTVNEDFGVGYSPERINPGDRYEASIKSQRSSQAATVKPFRTYRRHMER